MSSLLIKNASAVVTCDGGDSVLENASILIQNGIIAAMGPGDWEAGETLEAAGCIVYPGLINTHHHLYQTFSRNLPQVQNLELFDWLRALYEIWKNLDGETIYHSSIVGLGELLKTGCTTCFDHHYVFPGGSGDLLEAQFAAAGDLGIRMSASRGSMDLSKKDGGLPPDSVVQTVDEILRDSQAAVEKYHDPSFNSMRTQSVFSSPAKGVWPPAPPSACRRSCCASPLCWPGIWESGSTPIYVRRRMRRNMFWRNTENAPWPIWKIWAGWARTCGMPTASTSTIRN